jgi:hypothetical protein
MPEPTPLARLEISMRYASITMSNVAPATATRIAAIAVRATLAVGSWNARFAIAAITSVPATTSHDTRWPSRPSTGRRTPSTTQAQRNLRL